jgi:hypothetical protein
MIVGDIEGANHDDSLIGTRYQITGGLGGISPNPIPTRACKTYLDQVVPANLLQVGACVELLGYYHYAPLSEWAIFGFEGFKFFLEADVELKEVRKQIKLSKIWRS